MSKINIIFYIVVVWSAGFVHAAADNPTPMDVMNTYCALDYEGRRAGLGDYEPVHRLMSYYETGDGDESAWDTVTVVFGCTPLSQTVHGDTAYVDTLYENIVVVNRQGYIFHETNATERVEMQRVAGTWRLKRAVVTPRVSIDAALSIYAFHQDRYKIIRNGMFIPSFEGIMAMLRKLKERYPHTAQPQAPEPAR